MRLGRSLAFVASMTFACTVHASPEDIFGYGPRSPAMGGTGAAWSTGFEAAYTNPALLSLLREQKLSIGVQGGGFHLSATGDGLPGHVPYEGVHGILIGAEVPIPLGGFLRDRIGAALAVYTPSDVIVRGRLLYPETAQFPLYPDRSQSLALRTGIGVDVGWGIRAGIGFAALAEIDGDAVVATDATGRVGSRVEDQLIATYSPTVGLSYDLPLHDDAVTRIGLVYRGTLDARFAVSIDATKLSSLNIPVFNIAGMAQYDPAQLVLEIAREQGPWTLSIGATYKRWSQYPGPIEPTILCPADSPGCGALVPPSIAYSDIVVPRIGVSRWFDATKKLRLHFRGGAFLEPSPLPSKLPASQAYDSASKSVVDVPTRYFDGARLALTFGYGLEFLKPLPPITLDLYTQVHELLPRTVESDAPNAVGGPVTSKGDVSGTTILIGLVAGVKL